MDNIEKELRENVEMMNYLTEHANDLSAELQIAYLSELFKFAIAIKPIYLKALVMLGDNPRE